MSVALMASRGAQHPRRWTPKDLGTLDLWLDADDATTITIATGVSQWDDKSGNGRNVTQTTGSRQPTRVVNAQNGRAALRFVNASQQHLSGGDVLDILAGGLSIMTVHKGSSGAFGTNAPISKYLATAGTPNGDYLFGRRGLAVQVDASLRDSRDATESTGWDIVAGVLDRSTNLVSYRNGTQIGSTTGGLPNTTSYDTTTPLYVGARYTGTAAGAFLDGDIAEIVLSLATWTTAEREQVEGYLAHRWGLAGSLPSDHPYKSVSP